ncbi:MAG TPA: CAP domain-containing protein [Candidatus Binatia bacterium]|nr:CAP domain-containing protein [Candidatus Binatia bacterium]
MGWCEAVWRSGRKASSIAVSLIAAASTIAAASVPAARTPTNDEVALLVLANQSRANPSADGGTEPVQLPMWWNDALAAAAQAHTDDMAAHPGCFQHNSCNGTRWSTRVSQFYPGWQWLGENIGSGTNDPRWLHQGWMRSPDHRANLLGPFNEFGAAIGSGTDNFGPFPMATEDLGMRSLVPQEMIPTLPAGCILPRQGTPSEQRELLVNYFHAHGGPPRAVRAIVGSTCVDMTLAQGTPTHGTYRAQRALSGSGCVPLVFEAIRSDGARYRWPESEAILVAFGGASCAERTTNVPTRDCGGGGVPSPTPTATPTPAPTPTATPAPDGVSLSGARVVLKPGRADASNGRVNLTTNLAVPPSFDPTAGSIRVAVAYGSNGEWSRTLPALCGGKPCLKPSRRGTMLFGDYGDDMPKVTLLRAKNGIWRLRLAAANQTLAGLAPGPVTLEISAAGMTGTTELTGELRDQSLTAR